MQARRQLHGLGLPSIFADARAGDTEKVDQFFNELYPELRKYAAVLMRNERAGHTLQATALVHDAWDRIRGQAPEHDSRAFFRNMVTAMRRILIDHARAKGAERRGGERIRVPFDEQLVAASAAPDELLELDGMLQWMAAQDERAGEVARLGFYGGLTVDQIAFVLGCDERTVVRSRARIRELAGEWRLKGGG